MVQYALQPEGTVDAQSAIAKGYPFFHNTQEQATSLYKPVVIPSGTPPAPARPSADHSRVCRTPKQYNAPVSTCFNVLFARYNPTRTRIIIILSSSSVQYRAKLSRERPTERVSAKGMPPSRTSARPRLHGVVHRGSNQCRCVKYCTCRSIIHTLLYTVQHRMYLRRYCTRILPLSAKKNSRDHLDQAPPHRRGTHSHSVRKWFVHVDHSDDFNHHHFHDTL